MEKEKFSKIFKWIMWVLVAVSVGLVVWGFVKGYPATVPADNGTVEPLLYWAYAMVGIALACVVIGGIVIAAVNDPKSLVKLGIGLVVVALCCFIAYLTAAGNPAVGFIGEQPDGATLKLTDAILNLTYFVACVAIVSIVAGEIVSATRK